LSRFSGANVLTTERHYNHFPSLRQLIAAQSVPPAIAGGVLLGTMWNDTDIPLAYLISFRSYGTWLHGDARGSTDRFHNRYRAPHIKPTPKWEELNKRSLKSDPVILNASQRASVKAAIQENCDKRGWTLHALNARTNHVHSVVSIGYLKPERALNAFKANATRHMRRDGNWNHEHSPWADKGSKRGLWSDRSVERAIDYVLNGQGDELPDFD
jgi:REP element-mobilizing transposase RayT